MKNKNVISFLLSFTLGSTAVVGAEYIVRDGENLSSILYKNVPGRIYGKGNNLEKVLKLNPNITNPDLVYEGQSIYLPFLYPKKEKNVLAPKSVEKKEESFFGYLKDKELELELSLLVGGFRIDSSDKTSNVNESAIANIGYGIKVDLLKELKKDISLKLVLSLSNYSYEVTETKSLSKDSISKLRALLAVYYKLNEKHSLSMGIGLDELQVLRSTSTPNELEIDKARVWQPTLAGTHLIFKGNKKLTLNADWKSFIILPSKKASYDVDLSYGLTAGLSGRYGFKNGDFVTGVSYEIQSISFSNAEQTNRELLFSFGYSWNF